MNNAELLLSYIRHQHPKANATLTAPRHRDGMWSIDVDHADKHFAIEWSEDIGFGLSDVSSDTFGERPDEILNSLDAAKARVTQLLTTSEQISPPTQVLLARLRERKGVTQHELARRLGVRQATVSGIEHRSDIQLSTLRRMVTALGGYVEIFGVFNDGRFRLDIERSSETQAFESAAPKSQKQNAEIAVVRRRSEEVFVELRSSGFLLRATSLANDIKARRAVIEMPPCEQ